MFRWETDIYTGGEGCVRLCAREDGTTRVTEARKAIQAKKQHMARGTCGLHD